MTGLRASHARTCAHAFAYFRAAEAVPSLLSSLLDLSGLIQGFAREKGLFRGLFRLSRFFFYHHFFLPRAQCCDHPTYLFSSVQTGIIDPRNGIIGCS